MYILFAEEENVVWGAFLLQCFQMIDNYLKI